MLVRKISLVVLFGWFCMPAVSAQSVSEAYNRFLTLTSMFEGSQPYSCLAIVDLQYEGSRRVPIRDTSKLTYQDGLTYYHSTRVERWEDAKGVLIINHELQTATLEISDSLRYVLQTELNLERDAFLEGMLDSNFRERDSLAFQEFIQLHCHHHWKNWGAGIEEISFWPKQGVTGAFESIVLRFDSRDSKVVYYAYSVRDPYARDLDGHSLFRLVTTIYDGFRYGKIPKIPHSLDAYLKWEGWSVQLRKYTNYQFSLL